MIMKIYFFNSYQQSCQGFQLSELDTSDMLARLVTADEIVPDEIRSALTKSGASCLMGASGGEEYFLLRGMEVLGEDDRIWYINFAVTAPMDAHSEFWNFAAKVLLDYAQFQTSVKNWFVATPSDSLSYAIRKDALSAWLRSETPRLSDRFFYQKAHFATEQFLSMMNTAQQGNHNRLFLLVPESTTTYFLKQNEVFTGETPVYLFHSEIFGMLLNADPRLFLQEERKKEDAGETQPKDTGIPIWEQMGITEEQFDVLVKAGVLVAGGIATIGAIRMVSGIVKKIFPREEL